MLVNEQVTNMMLAFEPPAFDTPVYIAAEVRDASNGAYRGRYNVEIVFRYRHSQIDVDRNERTERG